VFPQQHPVRVCFCLIGFFAAQTFSMFGVPLAQSTSTSRQFVVYGTDVAVRGAICDLAEGTKRDLLAALAQRDSWITPIVINAHYPQANLPEAPRIALTMSQTGFGLKLQLDLAIGPEVNQPEVRRELLRALLVELMYRGAPGIPAGTAYSSPPDWLLDGIPAQEMNPEGGVTPILALPVTRRVILPLENFLRQKPELLDAPALSLYRAYSFALVELLIRAQDGPGRLARFIQDLSSAENDPMTGLRAHFPGLFDSKAMAEKTWETQIARLSNQQPYQLLGSVATERILDKNLHLEISAGRAKRICELAEPFAFLKEPSAKRVLNDLCRNLSALAVRANPIYRPVISEYGKIAATLLRGKTKGVAARLDRLVASRKVIAAQIRGIDDYLNWFEATSLRGPSGAFAGYLKAAESTAGPPPAKHDRISVYLDALETQFED
jgi:hypothetical protein